MDLFGFISQATFESFIIAAPHLPAPHDSPAKTEVVASKIPNNNPDNFIFIVILIPHIYFKDYWLLTIIILFTQCNNSPNSSKENFKPKFPQQDFIADTSTEPIYNEKAKYMTKI